MRSINRSFYKSAAWLSCRASYLAQHPLCEECLANGIYTPAEHVHHIVWLNAYNEHDPRYTLSHDNLRAVCIPCHNSLHSKNGSRPPKRYTVDATGKLTIRADRPHV